MELASGDVQRFEVIGSCGEVNDLIGSLSGRVCEPSTVRITIFSEANAVLLFAANLRFGRNSGVQLFEVGGHSTSLLLGSALKNILDSPTADFVMARPFARDRGALPQARFQRARILLADRKRDCQRRRKSRPVGRRDLGPGATVGAAASEARPHGAVASERPLWRCA